MNIFAWDFPVFSLQGLEFLRGGVKIGGKEEQQCLMTLLVYVALCSVPTSFFSINVSLSTCTLFASCPSHRIVP